MKLPQLEHSGVAVGNFIAIGLLATVGPGVLLSVRISILILLFVGGIVGGILGGPLFDRMTPSRAILFPHPTVGDLAQDVLALNGPQLISETSKWSKHDVWEVLRRTIAEQSGIDRRANPKGRLPAR